MNPDDVWREAIIEAADFLLQNLSDRSLENGLTNVELDWLFIQFESSQEDALKAIAYASGDPFNSTRLRTRLGRITRGAMEAEGFVRTEPIGLGLSGEPIFRFFITELGRHFLAGK